MEAASAFRQALLDGSATDVRALWALVYPQLPQPENDKEAAVVMHRARTEANSIPLDLRAYSHRWLTERGLPSGLADHLRPRAERMYPVVAEGTAIAVRSRSPEGLNRALALRNAMSDAVAEMYAGGNKSPEQIKNRLAEIRHKWRKT